MDRWCLVAMAGTIALGCGLSPIDHRIKLGEEQFVVFVGEGNDRNTDLFTATTGGEVFQLTFTTVVESAPALSGSGMMVAFLRARDTMPSTHRDVVVMNLERGAERIVQLPAEAGAVEAIGWGPGDSLLFIHAGADWWQASIPPTGAVATRATNLAEARRATTASLGQPVFAEAIACGTGLCLIGAQQDTTPLSDIGHDPMRWGADSVAWFEGNEIVVRPLGAGRARRMTLRPAPANPRQGSLGGAP